MKDYERLEIEYQERGVNMCFENADSYDSLTALQLNIAERS